MNYQQAKVRAEILKALAHPVRVLIVETLTKGDRCVCELNKLADIDQSNISRHLASLKKAGIVTDRRQGMKVFYRLRTPCILNALKCAVEVMKRKKSEASSQKSECRTTLNCATSAKNGTSGRLPRRGDAKS